MMLKTAARVGLLGLVAIGALGQRGRVGVAPTASQGMPVFEPDPSWPKLPNNWVVGVVSSVAVDRQDHVWILHRPRTVPEGMKDRAAPPVLEFGADGQYVNSWGGPAQGYDWPDNEHGITVDSKDIVWIGGSGATSTPAPRSDDMLLKFTKSGKFLMEIGGRTQNHGNADTKNLNRPADAFYYSKTNEVFVADGYGNQRVVVFDADTGAFKRMWGAFGNEPIDVVPAGRGAARGGGANGGGRGAAPVLDVEGQGSPQFGGPVHAVKVSNDALVYVA